MYTITEPSSFRSREQGGAWCAPVRAKVTEQNDARVQPSGPAKWLVNVEQTTLLGSTTCFEVRQKEQPPLWTYLKHPCAPESPLPFRRLHDAVFFRPEGAGEGESGGAGARSLRSMRSCKGGKGACFRALQWVSRPAFVLRQVHMSRSDLKRKSAVCLFSAEIRASMAICVVKGVDCVVC